MRRFILVFLMFCLPLQWAGAAVACCLDAGKPVQSSVHHQMSGMNGEHHHHDQSVPEKPSKHSCDGQCSDCHVHGAFVLTEVPALAALPQQTVGQSVYLSSLSSTVPDGLYRPPLAALV